MNIILLDFTSTEKCDGSGGIMFYTDSQVGGSVFGKALHKFNGVSLEKLILESHYLKSSVSVSFVGKRRQGTQIKISQNLQNTTVTLTFSRFLFPRIFEKKINNQFNIIYDII